MILVAGVGNIFMGDDAFGTEFAARLMRRSYPSNVHVMDFGIRSIDLLYELLDHHFELVVVVDVMKRGDPPGTLYVVEPHFPLDRIENVSTCPHSLSPEQVLLTAWSMGASVEKYRIVGCEPLTFGDDEFGGMGLSEPIRLAIDKAIYAVESLIGEVVQ